MGVPGNNDQRATDAAVIELLRVDSTLEIGDLAEALGVTATAIRQRLDRLMRSGLVERKTVARPRGRPAHAYSLTADGRRYGGDNFRDSIPCRTAGSRTRRTSCHSTMARSRKLSPP